MTDATTTRDPLDHDGDNKKGGSAPVPDVTHLVVVKDSKKHGLAHGEVIGVSDADAKTLLNANIARNATETEVELAHPRIRLWTPAA